MDSEEIDIGDRLQVQSKSIVTVERTEERVGLHAFSNLEGSSSEDIEDVETCEKKVIATEL